MVILVTCFMGLTAESRRAYFCPDPSHHQLADSTKIVECRAVDTVPQFHVVPHLDLPLPVLVEALPRLEVYSPPAAFFSPVYFFRPPPGR
ncbi:MAG: hypothetical protein NTY38_14250 [Acidobacteria bacterium]|nr:hypothetical protein [Acidobacteriota bacterium]